LKDLNEKKFATRIDLKLKDWKFETRNFIHFSNLKFSSSRNDTRSSVRSAQTDTADRLNQKAEERMKKLLDLEKHLKKSSETDSMTDLLSSYVQQNGKVSFSC
jgi:hypothetical protein